MRGLFRRVSDVLLPGILAAGLLGGCVYYNGMYNANRLANSARKAEREGRTFEANNLWGQVATKAESVIVRHPRSKYAEEAAILRGLALAGMGQCEQALSPLSRLAVAQLSSSLSEDAWLASGKCHLALGNVPAGDAAFSQVLESRDEWRRQEARFQRARILRSSRRFEEALEALDGMSEPRVWPELLLALAGAGRVPEAMSLADSLVARADTSQPWDSLVASLAQQDRASASRLIDRLRRLPGLSTQRQARWLLADGLRLASSDTARAAARFRETVKLGGFTEAAGRANLELVRLDLRGAARPQDLEAPITALRALAARYELVTTELNQLGSTAAGVLASYDSVTPGAPQGDLRLFLAAEAARDSLEAPRLAEGLFLRILNEWPDSPYAPKAVLAAGQLNSTWADSARAILEERYAYSPYLAMIRGEEVSSYRELEDSLGAFAAARAVPEKAPRTTAPGRRNPPGRRDDDTPGRRQQAPPSSRVVEP